MYLYTFVPQMIYSILSVHIGHKKKPRSIEETTKLFWVPGFRPSKCQNFPESNGSWLSELNSYWRGTKNDPRSATGSKQLEDRNPMDALIQIGVDKLNFFDLRCCIHQVIGCGEALVAVAFFWVCKFFGPRGSL